MDLDKSNIKLGGPGHVIQIDESLFARVKYNRGKALLRKQLWIFGMFDVKTDKCYLQVVPNRTAETLLGIIYEHTLPGSIIWSDQWASYNKINELHDHTIKHSTVNHSVNFVDPVTLTCTNRIEGLWSVARAKFKDMRGCRRLYVQGLYKIFLYKVVLKYKY